MYVATAEKLSDKVIAMMMMILDLDELTVFLGRRANYTQWPTNRAEFQQTSQLSGSNDNNNNVNHGDDHTSRWRDSAATLKGN